MPSRDDPSPPAIGFLTVVAHELHGFFGGYLVLNPSGRPLEFHCTTPVKPNRAQEILYGPTLEPFLYGEQIGRTLVEKSSLAVRTICTDLAAVLALREHVVTPLALVLPPDDPAPAPGPSDGQNLPARARRLDAAHGSVAPSAVFLLGRNRLAVAAGYDDDRQAVAAAIEGLTGQCDLYEPFARIRGAIDEAQRTAR